MFMFTAVKNNEAIFCYHLNASHTWHSIYENNEASLNSAGYSFRAFKIVTKTKHKHQVLINLGEAICQTLNAIHQNNNTAHIDPSNLLWICNPVWSDIAGYTKAHELLIDHTGNPQDKPNYYHDNKSLIHAYFAPNTLTLTEKYP